MTRDRDYIDALADILDAAEKVEHFIQGQTLESFRGNEEKVFAVIRGLEIVGEAAKQVPKDVREQHPQVPWRYMTGMRDVLIHYYFGVDIDRVWTTAHRDLPEVRDQIREILNELS